MGCGRQGARLAELLEAEKYDVVIIDKQSSAFSRLHNFKGQRMVGSGIDEETLRKAGIEGAYAFAAVTNGDNTNLMGAQMAKTIFEVPRVVCRVYDPARAGIYHDLGLETVSATTVGARMMRNLIIPPKILRQYQLGDGTAVALEFKLGPSTNAKKVKDLERDGEFRISCVVRHQEPHIVNEEFVLAEGDHIFGACVSSSLNSIREHIDVTEYAINFPSRGGY